MALLRDFFAARMGNRHALSLDDRRAAFLSAMRDLGPKNCAPRYDERLIGSSPALVSGPDVSDGTPIVLYFHGGAFVSGSPRTHLYFTAELAELAQALVCSIDYGLAPEHPFPAALDQAVEAFETTARDHSHNAIFLAGDSAGGNLALACALRLRERGLAPRGLILLSPFLDLTLAMARSSPPDIQDPFLTVSGLERDVARYIPDAANLTQPFASPVRADLSGLPPALLQVGTDEILLKESETIVAALRAAGVSVYGQIWEGMVHNWHLFPNWLPEASLATREIAQFIQAHSLRSETSSRN